MNTLLFNLLIRVVNVINRVFNIVFVFSFILLVYYLFFLNIVHCEGIELVLWGVPDTIGSIVGHRFTAAERGYWVMANVLPWVLLKVL